MVNLYTNQRNFIKWSVIASLCFISIMLPVGNALAQIRTVNFPALPEKVNARSRTSCTFKGSGSNLVAVISTGSVNYYENSQWNLIDLKVYSNGTNPNYPFINLDNSFKSYYPVSTLFPVKTVIDGISLTELNGPVVNWGTLNSPLSPGLASSPVSAVPSYTYVLKQKINTVNGIANQEKVTYPNAFSNTDIRLTQLSDGRHVDYILKNSAAITGAPAGTAAMAFRETIQLPKGWSWTISAAADQVDLFDNYGNWKISYTTPYIYEQNYTGPNIEAGQPVGKPGSISGTYEALQNGNELYISTLVDYSWLSSPARSFPVIVDPTSTVNPAIVNSSTGQCNSTTISNNTGGTFNVTTLIPARGWARFNLGALGPISSVSASNLTLQNLASVTSGLTNNVKGMTVNPLVGTGAALFTDIGATGVGTIYLSQTWTGGTGALSLNLNATANTAIFNAAAGPGFISMGLSRGSTNQYNFAGFNGPNPPALTVTFVSAVAADLGLVAPALPATPVCSGLQTVSVTLSNAGSSTWNFATNPATVTCSVTGPNPFTFTPQTINTGTLASLGTQVVTFASSSYNMSLSGTYTFTYAFSPTPSGDGNAGNNSLVRVVTKTLAVTASASPTSFCSNGTSQLTSSVSGNSVGYAVSSPAFSTQACGVNAGPTGDDAVMATQTIGFNFNYYGITYSQFTISTNGNIQLGNGTGSANNPFYSTSFSPTASPNAAVPNNIIGAPWADWFINNTAGTSEIKWGVTGVAPNRKLVVCFVTASTGSGIPGTLNSQIVLNETANTIEINITSITGSNTQWEGIENATGTLSTFVAGRNAVVWSPTSVSNDSKLFSVATPPTFSWSPTTGLSSAIISNPTIDASLLPVGNTTYTLTVTDPTTGCVSTQTVTVSNLGAGNAPPTTTGASTCPNVTVTLFASGSPTLNWFTAPTGGTLVNTGTSWTNTFSSTTTYYVTSDNGTCPSARTPVTVTVNTVIPVTVSATNTSLCLGGSATLSATSGSTLTYSQTFVNGASTIAQCQAWDLFLASLVPAPYSSVKMFGDGGGGNPVAVTGRTVTNPTTAQNIATALRTRTAATFTAADGTNTWRVALACGSGCGATPATVELSSDGTACACTTPGWTFRPNLTGSNSGGLNTATCAGPTQTMNLQFSSLVPLTSYSWAPGGSLSCTTCANPVATPTVTTTYTVTTTDPNNGCTVTATITITVAPVPPAPTATVNSVPCGAGNVNLSATGTGGTIKWFNTPSGTVPFHTGGAPFNQAVNSDTTFYLSETSLSAPFCEGPRTTVFINITDPDTISATISQSLICSQPSGSVTITLTVADVSSPQNNTYTYTWTQSTGGGLNSFSGTSVTANPTQSATYTVTAFQAGPNCTQIKTLSVSIGATPSVAPTATIINQGCDTVDAQLNANAVSSNFQSVNAFIGTGVVQNSSTTEPAPYGNFWGSNRTQMLIRATELSAAGLVNGSQISSLKFNVTSLNGTQALQAFTISLGLTNATALTAGAPIATPFNVVGPITYTPVTGLNTHTFGSNVTWDGVSSIVVNTCFFDPSFTSNCTFNQTATSFISCMEIRADGASQCGLNPGTTHLQRPNMVLVATSGTTVSVSWSPSTGLSSSTIQNPTAHVTTTTTYTVTATETSSGCSATGTILINLPGSPAAPACNGATVCGQGIANMTATGTGGNTIIWTQNASGGNIVATGGSYSPYVTATHSYGVRQYPSLTTNNVGYDPTATPTPGVGFFPTTNQGMWFKVNHYNGIILQSVDIYTNTPVGSPFTFAIQDTLGNTIGTVSGVTTATNPYFFPGPFGPPFTKQTVTFNIYIPFSTTSYILRPTQNPNMLVHQNATVAAGAPYQIPGVLKIVGYGNVTPPSVFGTNTFGFFYNWQVQSGCIGAACVATATVTTAPALIITPSGSTTFCGSGTVNLTASGLGYVNFSWAPAAGLSATTGATVTASPSVTTTYTVTANDGNPNGCIDTETVKITFNPAPFVILDPAPFDTLCLGTSFTFNSSAGTSTVKQIGFTENPSQVSGSVFNGANLAQREQMLFTAAQLNAAGITGPTSLTSIAFDVSNKLSTQPYTNFTVSIANASPAGCFPVGVQNYQTTGFTTDFVGNYTTTNGWNTINFTTPFAWNGTSDIIVNTCFTNPTTTGNFFDQVYTSSTTGCNSFKADNADACGDVSGTTSTLRPNVRFTGGAVNFSWSPSTELSSATIEDPVYQSLSVGNKSYTVTVTDPATSCTATASINFVVSTTPKIPKVAFMTDSVFCNSGTANMRAFGTTGTFQWQVSTDSINFVNAPCTSNNIVLPCDTFSSGVITAPRYYRVFVSCGGDSSFSRVLTAIVNDPLVASTVADTVCGTGVVCLQAFPNRPQYPIEWFAGPSGGALLASGDTFCTTIGTTTTFYAQANAGAAQGAGFATVGNGVVQNTTTTEPAPYGNFWGGNRTQMLIRGTELQAAGLSAGNLTSLTFSLPVAYTGAALKDFTISIGTTGLSALVANGFQPTPTQVYYSALYTPVTGNNLHTFATTFPWDGTSNIVINTCFINSSVCPNTSFTTNAVFNQTATAFTSCIWFRADANCAVCSNAATTGTANQRPNMILGGIAGTTCLSPRVAVIALSTPPPAIALLPPSAPSCEGTPVTITVDPSGQANYQVFTWSPAAGLNVTTGATVIATPLVTTTYTVLATDTIGGCAQTVTSTITVTQRPTISSITVNPNPVCQGDSAQITVTAIPVIPPSGGYTVGSIAFAPVTPTGTPVVLASGGVAVTPMTINSLDDGTWENISLPAGFAFNYYGTTPTKFNVSTNGFITFGATLGTASCCSGQIIPNAGIPNNYLAMAHEDWNVTSGSIDYFTKGVAPFRKFVVRAIAVPRFGGSGAPTTAMIVLNETFNTIEMHLTSVTSGGSDFTTQGIENSTGTLATVVAGRNSAVWSATNEGWMFSPPVNSSLTYSWTPPTGLSSTSVSNPKASPAITTNYTVTVFESGTGCSRSQSLTVNVTPKPKPYMVGKLRQNILGDTIVCSNDPGFYIQVKDSGAYAGGYPAGTTFEFVGLTPPSNTVDSTFVNSSISETVIVTLPAFLGGCSATAGAAPGSPANIDFGSQVAQQVALTTDSVGCFGESTGKAIGTIVFGGTPNFRWQWYNSSFTLIRDTTDNLLADTLFGVPAGWYYLTSTDHQGVVAPPYCQVIDSIFIGEPSAPLNVVEVLANHVDVQCYGYGTGAIDITITGGVPGYNYAWSNGSTTQDQSGLVAGIYTVTVTDQHGCTFVFATEIVQNPQVTIGTAQSNVSCHKGFDGTATVYVNGGVPGYTYLWSDGQTTVTAFNLSAGTYTVIITDSSGTPGCDTIMTFLISEPSLLDATGTVVNLNCYGATNGVATANPFGGTPPYSYSWNSIPVQTTQTATGLPAGTIVATITDSVGCTKDLVLQITQPDSLYFDKTIDNVTCNGGSNGSITISVNGGTPGYTYLWSNGGITSTITGLTAGTYVVTVTDANGCQVIGSILVNQPSAINIAMSHTNATCYGLSNGSALATVSGGTSPYAYSWNSNPAQSTNSASGLPAGSYTVVVTDAAGCTSSANVTITQPDSIALNPNVTQPLCNGGTGSVQLFITGGTTPYGIIWSNGNTTQTNGGLVAGTYTVTVADANGCVNTKTFVISAPSAIIVTPTVTNVSCFGSTNGSIVVATTGGVGPYTYQWSNGSTNTFRTGLAAGNYTVTVTDANSCSVTLIVTVTQPAQLTCICNSNVTNVSCFGGSNGSVTAMPMGGTAPYSYSWKRIAPTVSGVLATTQTISGLTAGTYQVTITDANGCVKVGTAVITQPTALVVTTTAVNNSCSGSANGQITATVSGGVAPYTYSWNTVPSKTTAIATGLTAGTYTVVVTDANGCTKSASATITQPTGITLTTSKNNVSCNGGANGTANVTATGGVTPYSYMWSNGKTTKNVTGLAAGIYTVTVTDANGCTKTANVTITQPSKITALYVVTNPTCFGSANGAINLTVTGGAPPYTYAWSTGATTQNLSGLVSGAYSVLITDNKGCVILANIILTQPNAIALSSTVKNATCFGSSTGKVTVLATGGTSPYTYLWSNGQTNASANNLAAGIYTVTVTDTKGCTKTTSATVTQSPVLVCSANVVCMNNVTCFGGSNGKLCVSVTGGLAPYTYVWNTSPVATTASVNNVPAGTYTVVVTDKNGCTTSCTFTITQPAALVVAPLASSNVSCNGGNNGTVSITTVTGGTPPYTYLWNTGVAATTTSVSGLTAGTYQVTVTDANGCTATKSVVITQPTQIVLTVTPTNLSCNGAGSGSITATATGGVGGYTYTLNPGAVSNGSGVFTGLAAGTYSVTVTDANVCSVTVSGIVLTQPSALTMGATSGTNVSCFGGNNGTATAGTIAGGTPPYTYNWNTIPPQGTATATGLTAGTYTVMVTDAKVCTVSGTVTVTQPAAPLNVAIINQTNITCNGGTTGAATANATGGTAPYTYLWSDGQTNATATGLAAGTYVVTATDANGCQATTSVVISQPNAFVVSATSTNVSCNGGSDGTITATVTGGNSPVIYTLNPGAISNGTGMFTGLAIGTYTVTASDAGGCTSTISVIITQPGILIANATSTNVSCNGGANGTATVFATGGTAPYTYAWTGGSTLQNPSGLAAGTYTVVVTDAKGCTLSRTVTITQPAALVITKTQVNVNCNGGATGSATATVSGGTAPYFYMWSNGQMGQTANGLTAGTYTVTVTDYKGCTVTAVYTITQGSSIVANPAQGTITCFGGTTTISVTPTGANAPYSYSWSQNPLITTNSAVVGAGSYYVVITDATGCQVTQSFTVTSPSALICGSTSTNVTCNGAANGTATASASGGTAPYAYVWTGGSTNASISGLAPGTYTVVITDANLCTTSCTVNITQPAVLSLSLSNSNASCGTNNGSAMAIVSGGTAPYTYLWSGGQTTASISGLAAGTYIVTVNDAKGCGPVSASVTIGGTPPVSCSITGTNPSCAGYNNGFATVNVTGGAGSNTYSWNTAPIQTTATATGLAAGTYGVTVTDISGCSSTCSVQITEPSPLVLTASQSNSVCSGGASGIATVTAFGGTPPYSYLWSNGQTTATATGLPAGSVYITVTDGAGCSAVLAIIMQQPVAMSCNTSTTSASCGQATGTATVNVFGGQGPYSYNWNTIPQQSNAIATNLTAGTYTVVVTDANGCSTQCTATVVQPGGVSYILTVVNPNCNGGTGSVSVTLLNGGTAPYTYVWSNGSSTATSGPVVAGTYTVTVTDANGCSNVQSATVVAPSALVATTTHTNVNCFGNVNGSACVSATGGTQPYSYLWSTGANSQCISNLAAGTYTVTATDSKGCTSSAAVVITQPAVLDTISTITTVASCGLSNGTATVNPTGGTPPYTYSWNTSPVQTTQTATGLPAGNNFVTITDANGCSITICVKVPSSAGIGLSLVSPVYAGGYNIRCNGGADGSINLTVSGSGPYTYTWSNSASTEDLTGLSAGTYTVTVTNGGCTSMGSITLTEAPAWTVSTTQVNVTCFGGNNGSATVTANGGPAPYSYSWTTTPVQTTQTATGLTAGTYTVTVSDANGCTHTAAVTITQPSSGLSITATSVNPSCNGSSNGSINITVTGGTPPYSYLWTGGATTEDRSGIAAGSHTVTVTDANGCTISLCVVLVQPTQIALTISKTDVACSGGTTGSASVTAAGGTPGYTYLWNNGKTTAANNNIAAGTYTVTVTDANGCIRNATVTITSAAPIVLTTSKTDVTVYGGNNGTATVSASGGTPVYAYSWNTVPVQTNATATGLTAGTYQITVTDSKGCVKTASVTITQPNYNCSSGTPFRTETPSRWGASSGTANTYLTANFGAAFPGGLVVGGGCVGAKTLTLTSATAVRNYEVNQNVSGSGTVLSANLVNPTSTTFPSALGANTVALKLNVTFDAYDPNFAPIPTVPLGNLIYNAAPFSGLTVNQILSEANKKLGGCSSAYTVSQLNTALQNIDSAYKAGVTGPTASFLVCPSAHMAFTSNPAETNSGITAYPNPSAGEMNIKFTANEDGKVVVNLLDVTGRLVWNVVENVFIGENIRTYDYSQLRKGIYLMQVTKDGRTDIVRIVLQ